MYNKFISSSGSVYHDSEYYYPYHQHYKENLFGLLGSLNINIIDRKKFEAGISASMLTSFTEGYFNCDGLQSALHVGLKF